MQHVRFFIFITFATALVLVGCNDAGFNSKSDTEKPPVEAFGLCKGPDNTYNEEDLVIFAPNDGEKLKLQVSGDYCPQSPAELHILFLIDFSLSMYNAKESRGNDQLVDNKTCGRLEAAKAIIDRHFENSQGENTRLNAGVVSFSSDVDDIVPLAPLADFKDNDLSVHNFCRGEGRTNYKAAFDEAKSMLKDKTGTKVIYLVTDGLPSLGGDADPGLFEEHQNAAIDSAKGLRASVENLTLNAVYLGNEFEEVEFDPIDVLEDITGSSKRVKLVDSADKLAAGILTLENPPVNINTTSAKAYLELSDQSKNVVKITSFEAHPTRDQVWSFATEPFVPFQKGDTNSRFVIEANDVSGETYAISFDIVVKPAGSDDTLPESDSEVEISEDEVE